MWLCVPSQTQVVQLAYCKLYEAFYTAPLQSFYTLLVMSALQAPLADNGEVSVLLALLLDMF